MKKSLLICLLVLSIFMMMLPAGAATDKTMFDVRVPSEMPKAGETFEVAVEIKNNPGFCAIQFTLAYDEKVMQCNYVATDGVAAGSMAATNPKGKGGAIVAAASLDVLEGDGAVALYEFTAKEDITAFDFGLNDIVLADENNKDIEYEVAEGISEETTPPAAEDKSDEEVPDKDEENAADDTVSEEQSGGSDAVTDEKESVEAPVETPDVTPDDVPGEAPETLPEEDTTESEDAVIERVFPDVIGHWAEKYVNDAVKQGLFQGGTDGNFNPDDNVTRAQFVTVLWRMAGRPEASQEHPFTDIDTQPSEFKTAIAWGYAKGYIKGTSDTTFAPEASLTREAGMKILHLYSGGEVGKELQLYGVYDGTFEDSVEISEWAKNSVYWGVYNKLISGVSADMLSPKGTATRAQLAKILVSYLDIN